MTGSLQEQLMKSGLVSEQDVKNARKKKSKQYKKGKQVKSEPSLAEAYAKKTVQERKERDRELNQRREEARRRKELKEKLRQTIVPASKNDPKAELTRHFHFAKKIRKIYVNKTQQDGLNSGEFGIAYHAGRHYVVERAAIEKIKLLNPDAVSFYGPDVKDDDVDDEYAEFKVPDDLQW